MKNKVCNTCKVELSIEMFNKLKSSKDGYQSTCRECMNKYKRLYRKNNKTQTAKFNKLYRKTHKVSITKYQKLFREGHRMGLMEYKKGHYQSNKKHASEQAKKYYIKNKANLNLVSKIYREDNREDIASKAKIRYKANKVGNTILKDHIEVRVLAVAKYIIRMKVTIRKAAIVFRVSKSTIYKDITERLPEINPQLAAEVKNILDHNYLRGTSEVETLQD